MTAELRLIRLRRISLGLILGTVVVYAPVVGYDFINFDDPRYVTENPHVLGGLSLENVRWAFTSRAATGWQPLTWLTHMLDVELYGLHAGGHHLTNLLFHLASTLLLLRVLGRMTGAPGPAAFVAGVFALHPLHVESVAWVAERKDVLSAFFWMLTLAAYTRYAERPTVGRYLVTLGCFVGGLMSKPMVVTLPFVLLLLDHWPLQRIGRVALGPFAVVPLRRAVAEKVPMLVLSAVVSWVTFSAKQGGGAVVPLETFSLAARVGNALVGYLRYLGMTLWPSGLAAYYPIETHLPLIRVILAAVILLGLTAMVWRAGRKYPYLTVGWLWFLGTLVPVIGLVQVGGQALADRFMYLPLIGLGIMAAWGGRDLLHRLQISPRVVAGAAAALLVVLAVASRLQVRHWRDSLALFERAHQVTQNDSLAHFCMGCALSAQRRSAEAVVQYLEALRIEPHYAKAGHNLEIELGELARSAEAGDDPSEGRRLRGLLAEGYLRLGLLLWAEGRREDARARLEECLRFQPDCAEAKALLASARTENSSKPANNR